MNTSSRLPLEAFPSQSFDKIRYGDTDRQGHVNNAVFSTYLETGRVELMFASELPLMSEKNSFVIASLNLQLLAEINWPGKVDIGTGVMSVGNSSMRLLQGVFQDGQCVATAETVIVQVDNRTRKSDRLSDQARRSLSKYLLDSDLVE
ncbi:thioesterase family protein [Marinobacterium maritimum]|uniref:Thioesterase family protein n=1 Tax=Marinobacterium maritimum TaxID=500162 RepID=A0ABP3TGB2_9GAMM